MKKNSISNLIKSLLTCIILLIMPGCTSSVNDHLIKTGICILGGSEAGFTAAIQASRLGKNVVLIEPTGHPGGMLVEGLGKDIRFGSGCVIGGIAREFYINVEKHYGLQAGFDNPEWYSKYEPSVAEETIERMLEKETHITIIRKVRIKEQNGGKLFMPSPNRHNGKTDLGSWHDLSANLYGKNWKYPNGNYKTQDSIIQYHRDFTIGLIWFLQNDPDVDKKTRENWEGWGLPGDEFTDNGHWPRRLYIRSARRMVSDYMITEYNTKSDTPDTVSDPVGIAWWPPDMHHARRIVKDGYAYNEGFTHVEGNKSWKPFKISYKASIPKRAECTNIITPTCLSSSYVGYGSIRILPTFMVLGQSVAAAASIAVDERIDMQDVPYQRLKPMLLENKQILKIPDNWLKIISLHN